VTARRPKPKDDGRWPAELPCAGPPRADSADIKEPRPSGRGRARASGEPTEKPRGQLTNTKAPPHRQPRRWAGRWDAAGIGLIEGRPRRSRVPAAPASSSQAAQVPPAAPAESRPRTSEWLMARLHWNGWRETSRSNQQPNKLKTGQIRAPQAQHRLESFRADTSSSGDVQPLEKKKSGGQGEQRQPARATDRPPWSAPAGRE